MIQIPIYSSGVHLGAFSPRVEEPGINLIRSFAYSAPARDVKIKRPLMASSPGAERSSVRPGDPFVRATPLACMKAEMNAWGVGVCAH